MTSKILFKKAAHRLELLSLDESSELEAGVYAAGSSRRLYLSRVHEDGVDPVEVGVDHDGRAPTQVHVLLPPVGDVVARPPGFEGEVALQLYADPILELLGQLLHSVVVGVVKKRPDASQILQPDLLKLLPNTS